MLRLVRSLPVTWSCDGAAGPEPCAPSVLCWEHGEPVEGAREALGLLTREVLRGRPFGRALREIIVAGLADERRRGP